MSSGIDKTYDRQYSTKGVEWHGTAIPTDRINKDTIRDLFFKIHEGQNYTVIDGIVVPGDNTKLLVADFRGIRPDLEEKAANGATDEEGNPVKTLLTLHTPKEGYQVITNEQTFDAAEACVAGLEGAEFTSAFTLNRAKVFGVSVDIGQNELNVKRHNGKLDKILANLNVITSHDGSYACMAYDSTIRIVCMNTLRWSLQAAGDVGFKVYHTANADSAMRKFPELVNAILTGRAQFQNQMEYFDSVTLTHDEALYLVMVYLFNARPNKKETVPSSRIVNAAEEIKHLFVNGRGNLGQTYYDLLNGVTEYYTLGNGTGMRTSAQEKAFKADFGKAADHKNAFVNFLTGATGDEKEKLIGAGRRLYELAQA
jgi:hypothetical protein